MQDFDWQFDATHPECAKALEQAIRFCSDMAYASDEAKATGSQAKHRWLSLLGPSGRGKSHLARKIAEWRKTKGSGRFFYRWASVLENMRNDRENIALFMERCRDKKLMVIDDIGAAHETEFAASVLFDIADTRIGLPTVFTSNLNVEGIAKIDSRIASRLFRDNSEVFTFKAAPDYPIANRRAA